MKKWFAAAAAYPFVLVAGWISTKFSERWAVALDELEYEFGLDDKPPVPDPLKVLKPVEPWHGKASSENIWNM